MANSEQSKRINKLRAKLGRGTASEAEKMEIAQWDAIPRRGRKPKLNLNSLPTIPSNGNANPPTPSGAPEASDSTHTQPISVHSNLPGMDGGESGEPNLPPMNVDPTIGAADPTGNTTTSVPGAGSQPNQSSTTTGQTPGHSASNASTNGNAPKVTPAEAQANAREISAMVTSTLAQLNNWTVTNGGPGMPPLFFAQFDMSLSRLLAKYAGNMVQEDVDMFIVVGSGTFVGYNAWQTNRKLKREGKDKNSVERHPTPAPSPEPKQGPPPPVVKPNVNGAINVLPSHEPGIREIINPNGNRVY
jgi:hypothetical protein